MQGKQQVIENKANSHPQIRTRINNMRKHIRLNRLLLLAQTVEVYPYFLRININKRKPPRTRRRISHLPHLAVGAGDAEVSDVGGKAHGVAVEWRQRGAGVRKQFLRARPAGGENGDVYCAGVVNEEAV
jgi:hypothetical protein